MNIWKLVLHPESQLRPTSSAWPSHVFTTCVIFHAVGVLVRVDSNSCVNVLLTSLIFRNDTFKHLRGPLLVRRVSQNCRKRLFASTMFFFFCLCRSALKNSAPTGRIFMKFVTWGFFRKSVKKYQVWLKYDKNNSYFTWTSIYIYLVELFLQWEMFQMRVVEKIKLHILRSTIFFLRKSCRLWDSVDKYCRSGEATGGNIW